MKQNPWLRLCSFVTFATIALPAAAQGPGRFFGPDKYPLEAMRLRQQGRVAMHLIIAVTGNVEACTVTTSSGSPSLDADACDKALKRVRFTPAKDSMGQPVEGTYDLSVRYVLP
jgi:protein TonB